MDADHTSFPLVMKRNRLQSDVSIPASRKENPGLVCRLRLAAPQRNAADRRPPCGAAARSGGPASDSKGEIFPNPLVIGDGLRFFAAMRERKLEGMVAKRLQSPYRIGGAQR